MGFKEYTQFDAIGIADLIKKGEISPDEVLDEAIVRTERINPKINAVIVKMYDEAKDLIKQGLPDAPFKGVPIMLKDILQLYKGVRYTLGSKLFKDYMPDIDSEYVKRLKNAGFVIIGKTNVPEFGLMGVTEPEYFGPTHNPWNLEHTPGGSSGGSAAAVAAGLVPLATGNDGGGSIRIPSSCCGLFGLKPSRGRTPNGPTEGEVWMGLVVQHVLTRSVRDSALVLDLTQGAEPGSPYEIKEPNCSYYEAIQTPPKKLRIAFSVDMPLGGKLHPACKNAVLETAKILENLGHIVEEARPKLNFEELAQSYVVGMFGEVNFFLKRAEKLLNKRIKRGDVEDTTWLISRIGEAVPIWKASWSKFVWDSAARIMGQFHQKYDLYMTPTMSYPPAKIGELTPSDTEKRVVALIESLRAEGLSFVVKSFEKLAYKQLSRMPFTQLANQTGQPAISVPLFMTKNSNLPIGVHFMAKFGDEVTLLKLAAQLEKAKPWFDRTPDI